jgi:DNA repair exonuclease SbcCD ATPase subunit
LIDDYARGKLTPKQQERFEQNFLISKRRREKVEVARALFAREKAVEKTVVIAPVVEEENVSWWSNLSLAFLFAPRPAFAYSFAALAFALLLGGLWLYLENKQLRSDVARLKEKQEQASDLEKQNEKLKQQSADKDKRNEELNAQVRQERERLAETQSDNEKLQRELDRIEKLKRQQDQEQSPISAIAAFILTPQVRGEGEPTQLVVSQKTRVIRLRLDIERGDEYPLYRVELRTEDGKLVRSNDITRARKTAAGRAVMMTVPLSLLNADEYEIALKGSKGEGQFETLRFYYFSILKR